MGRVKTKGSAPEMSVRRTAHGLGYRFRLHARNLSGTPDLVFPKLKKVIFVHGCFWHRHPGCPRTTTPKTRAKYWSDKFVRNIERDAQAIEKLEALGWDAMVIWECETFDSEPLARRLQAFLEK